MDHTEFDTDFDPEQRELCPDGACLGIIGPNGRCNLCGALSPNPPGAARTAPGEARTAPAEVVPGSAAPSEEAPTPVRPRETEGEDFDPARRELCPDGACLGVIGPDGRCKLCGRAGLGEGGDPEEGD